MERSLNVCVYFNALVTFRQPILVRPSQTALSIYFRRLPLPSAVRKYLIQPLLEPAAITFSNIDVHFVSVTNRCFDCRLHQRQKVIEKSQEGLDACRSSIDDRDARLKFIFPRNEQIVALMAGR